MQTIRVYSRQGGLIVSFTGSKADVEEQLKVWLSGRPESDFKILR